MALSDSLPQINLGVQGRTQEGSHKYPPSTNGERVVKSMGLKVLWVVTAETTSSRDWRIFPSPSVPCLNCGGGDRWCCYLSLRSIVPLGISPS
ncbi:hypothetical protein TNCV_4810321 [Trichonephila clavipes]|nr:hypothetical protein TNCV_4810321 [Trichonephila clavipes]